MKERPILFSAPMVRAILAGTKTQTRRALRGFYPRNTPEFDSETGRLEWFNGDEVVSGIRCPYGQPGDRLWVREAWRTTSAWDLTPPRDLPGRVDLHYEADGRPNAHFCFGKLRPGMFMPRGASRITLEVTGVHVERLRDISEADAIAEGAKSADLASGRECIFPHQGTHRWGFQLLWESIYGPSSWDTNPWVWVVEFNRVEDLRAAA